jgi:hypothetical protein
MPFIEFEFMSTPPPTCGHIWLAQLCQIVFSGVFDAKNRNFTIQGWLPREMMEYQIKSHRRITVVSSNRRQAL